MSVTARNVHLYLSQGNFSADFRPVGSSTKVHFQQQEVSDFAVGGVITYVFPHPILE